VRMEPTNKCDRPLSGQGQVAVAHGSFKGVADAEAEHSQAGCHGQHAQGWELLIHGARAPLLHPTGVIIADVSLLTRPLTVRPLRPRRRRMYGSP
jgi:hypothetical protein